MKKGETARGSRVRHFSRSTRRVSATCQNHPDPIFSRFLFFSRAFTFFVKKYQFFSGRFLKFLDHCWINAESNSNNFKIPLQFLVLPIVSPHETDTKKRAQSQKNLPPLSSRTHPRTKKRDQHNKTHKLHKNTSLPL